ncbi:MAG: SH3 domain-containing protein [Clostridia bacterium]|nr:SH3 domain-containing protein [Clostridia bacterium]
MKKFAKVMVLAVLIFTFAFMSVAQAELISPYGAGQIGYSAVVLCEEISVRQKASASSKILQKLPYGSHIIVMQQSGNWAYVALGDSESSLKGWVNSDYIVTDPAWYRTIGKTTVYAWNSTKAPKVGLLESNVILPVLKVEGDWIVVSLRGASGWIHK